jgi:insertion element IS1 protein InsB
MKCRYCNKDCIRRGIRNGVQQYFCKACGKYQRQIYIRPAINPDKLQTFKQLNNESMGIRSIARILYIAPSSVIKYLTLLSSNVILPKVTTAINGRYEIDELQTYIGKNEPSNYIWITYAIDSQNGTVVDFVVC